MDEDNRREESREKKTKKTNRRIRKKMISLMHAQTPHAKDSVRFLQF